MRRDPLRQCTLWLAFAFLAACACADPPEECSEPPDCGLAACEGEPECTDNGEVEDCTNGVDDDADGLADEADPDCVDDLSPSDGTDCVGQEVTTVAGGDTDSLIDTADCEDPIGSDSGDGDTVEVEVTQTGGVVVVAIDFTENGIGASPAAEIAFETETFYEPGGDTSLFAVIDVSDDPSAQIATTCVSRGYTIDLDGSARGRIPTLPPGGSYICNTTVSVTGDGSPSSGHRIVVGTGLADDGDGDGVADANDIFCPNSQGPVETCGCAACGTYLGEIEYGCNVAPPVGICVSSFPTPFFCTECGVATDDLVATVSGPANDIAVGSDGRLRCNGCLLEGKQLVWNGYCAFCTEEATGRVICDETQPAGTADGCDFEIGASRLGSPLVNEILVIDRDAFTAAVPLAVQVDVETDGDDLVAAFELESGGRTSEHEIETAEGVGEWSLRFVYDSSASITWLSTTGWVFESHDCPGDGVTATVDVSAECLFRLTRLDTGDRIPLTQTGIEVANRVASNFGDLGLGELFSVSGANSVGVYRADNFGFVPSLSRIGGLQLTNVIGSLHLDLPGFPNDGHFYYQTPFGTGITQYFPEIPGFGATLVSNTAVRDATYVDGDPNVGRGVFATSGGVQSLTFQDFGGSNPFLSSNPVVFGAPSGFSITSAFQTSASSQILFAARNNTVGANGRLFLGTGTIATAVGDLGVDPRLLRCASALPGTWICVAPNFESSNVSVATWNGTGTAAVAGTLATGPNPLVPGIAAANGEVRVLIPSYTGDTATALRLDGATGAEVARETYALPPGALASSALILEDASTGVVTLRGSNELQIIRPAFGF